MARWPSKNPADYLQARLPPKLGLAAVLVALSALALYLVARAIGPEYESQAHAAKRLGMRVDCEVEAGPRLPRFKGTPADLQRETMRIILGEARASGTVLNRIVAGRPFRLADPGLAYASDGWSLIQGGSWTLVFKKPIPVDAVVPETGRPPTGTGKRYVRRLGYFRYKVHVTGRVRSLEVDADARSGEVAAIRDRQIGEYASIFRAHRPLRGTCPLRAVSHNTGE